MIDLPRPFDYPDGIVHRKHAPSGFKRYQEFKDWLRDEFIFRCIYCLFRETWYNENPACFSVEHLVPRSAPSGRELELKYENLGYACGRCNSRRRAEEVANPNSHPFRDHLEVDMETGHVKDLGPVGRETIRILRLNNPEIIEYRQYYLRVLALKAKLPDDPDVHFLYVKLFRFPKDLPDLRRLRPPGGNPTKSEESCYFVLRECNELPEVY